jgi:hypothetical protein
MMDPLAPPKSPRPPGTRHARIVRSARMLWRRIASPHGRWLAILTKGGACSAMVSCCLTMPGRSSLTAEPSPQRPPASW